MKISVIGAGEMGGALSAGLLKSSSLTPSDITVADRSEERLDRFAQLGASVTTDNKVAVVGADIVFLVVKPGVVHTVIEEIKDQLDYNKQLVVNCAASITLAMLEEWLDKDGTVPALCQAIPNIGIEHHASMTFLTPNAQCKSRMEQLLGVLNEMGETLVVTEDLLFAGTAVSSCGIAYVMRFLRAATEAAVELGFRASDGRNIMIQTMEGAVRLLKGSGDHPEAAIDKVTTPGGMTIRGLNAMERGGFSSAVIEGIKASLKK